MSDDEALQTEDRLEDLSLGHRAEIGRVEHALFGGTDSPVTIGRFRVRRVVGRGAFGVVYEATDPELDRQVAVKVLAASDGAAQAKLLGEARLMATVTDPNIATVYEVGTFDYAGGGKVFVAMEFVVGATLRDYLRERPRSPSEVVELLLQAGRGLRAAHSAGVVHRDFKPDNVLVGADGRVRVVDFGLASSASEAGSSTGVPLDDAPIDRASRTRGVAGTPAYMAPEVFTGSQGDALSDQFSFCVTAYEALYGQRPFEGGTLAALAANVTSGRLATAPAQAKVPSRLRRVVVRGLQPEPAQRFEDMSALLHELQAMARRRLTRRLLSVGALAAGVGIAAGALFSARSVIPVPACAVDAGSIYEVWSDRRQHDLRQAFEDSAPNLGPPTWSRVQPRIDAFARLWATTATASCERPSNNEQARELRDLEAQCLVRARAKLDDLLAEFTAPNEALIGAAVRTFRSPFDVARCLDPVALLASRPHDPEAAAKVDAVRGDLELVGSDFTAGRYEQARRRLQAAGATADAIGFAPLIADTKLRLAQLDLKQGHYPSSRALAREAFDLAVPGSNPRPAVAATIVLAQAGVADPKYLEEGLSWVNTGRSLLSRLSEAPQLASGLAVANASLHITAADTDHATTALQEAIVTLRAEDPDHPDLPVVWGNWGTWLLRQGRPREAIARYEQAASASRRALGPGHPDVAQWLLGLGTASMTVGDLDKADEYLQSSLDLHLQTVGEGHPNTIQTRMYLGVLAHNRLEYDLAIEYFEAALESAQEHLGKDHVLVADVCLRLADTFSAAQHHEDARRIADQARRIYEAMLPPDDPRLAVVYATGLVTAVRAGRPHDGLAQGRRGLAVTQGGGDLDPVRVNLLHETGRVLVELGQIPEAIELLQRARTALETGVEDPRRRALVSFDLARARFKRDPAAARRHAQEALTHLPADVPAHERAEILQWLEEHKAPGATVGSHGR